MEGARWARKDTCTDGGRMRRAAEARPDEYRGRGKG